MAETEIVTEIDMPVGQKVRILKRLDFSQPPFWTQDEAWIFVKLRHSDGEIGLAAIAVDDDQACLLSVSQMKEFANSLAEATDKWVCLGEDDS